MLRCKDIDLAQISAGKVSYIVFLLCGLMYANACTPQAGIKQCFVVTLIAYSITLSSEAESFEGVQICETDDNGIEHCRSLSEGINGLCERHTFTSPLLYNHHVMSVLIFCTAEVMAEPDCVCVGDRKGHSVCMPDNCDANRPTRRRG